MGDATEMAVLFARVRDAMLERFDCAHAILATVHFALMHAGDDVPPNAALGQSVAAALARLDELRELARAFRQEVEQRQAQAAIAAAAPAHSRH